MPFANARATPSSSISASSNGPRRGPRATSGSRLISHGLISSAEADGLVSCLGDPIGNQKRRPIRPGQKLVCLGVADERFGAGVKFERAPDSIIQPIERQSVFLEVLFHTRQSLEGFLIVPKCLQRLAERHLLA